VGDLPPTGADRQLTGAFAGPLGLRVAVGAQQRDTASRVCTAAGARVVALDAAVGMLAHDRRTRPAAVAGDAYRLPFRAASFDAVVAAFVFNHLDDPVAALAEAARVTRPGGALLAATFHADWEHPAKQQVEAAATEAGWRRPAWYDSLKSHSAPALGDPDRFAATATGRDGARRGWSTPWSTLVCPAPTTWWRGGWAWPSSRRSWTVCRSRRAPGCTRARRLIGADPEPLRPRVLFCLARLGARRQPDQGSASKLP
jgi:SAM-dependent methyltransferase